MGPGTHIVDRIKKGILPINAGDAAALIHDIEYLGYEDQSIPDATAINNAGFPYNLVMFPAFKAKQLLGKNIGPLNIPAYNYLKTIVNYHPVYKELEKYNLYWSDGSKVRH